MLNLKSLFYKSKGHVVATSSKRGQTSLGPKSGGIFSISFWDEIYRVEQGQGIAKWKNVMDLTKKRTLEKAKSFGALQEPVVDLTRLEVDGEGNDGGNDGGVIHHDNIVVISLDQDLAQAFKRIVDTSINRTERLNMVNGIAQRLFTSDAKVIMVGRNLETKLGLPIPISKYLEELALSKTVKGVNIVRSKKNSEGKFSQIVVSEIR